MGWFKSKYAETDIISVQPVTIDGIYSNMTRISMKKHITEEMRIPCGMRQAKCYITAKTNLWADFLPRSRVWSAPAAAVNNTTTDARVVADVVKIAEERKKVSYDTLVKSGCGHFLPIFLKILNVIKVQFK